MVTWTGTSARCSNEVLVWLSLLIRAHKGLSVPEVGL